MGVVKDKTRPKKGFLKLIIGHSLHVFCYVKYAGSDFLIYELDCKIV